MISMLLRYRFLALGLLLGAVGALGVGLPHAAVPDNALTVWFLSTDPQLETYERLHQHFGNDETIMIQVEASAEPGGVLNPKTVDRIRRLTTELEAIDGINAVHSIFNIQDAVSDANDTLRFEPAVPKGLPTHPEALEALRGRLVHNPLFAERLISPDGRRAMLWVQMDVMDDIDAQRDAIVNAVRSKTDALLGEQPHPMGGLGVIYSGLNLLTQKDFGTFVPLGYLIMFVMLWWVFRSGRLVAAAFGVIVLATVATLGTYGLMGHRLNMVTVVLPTLIIVLGIADAVHFPAAFVQLQATGGLSPMQRAAAALGRVLWPCLMTTLTTMVGFLALSTSPMAVIQHLGIYAAIGVGFALIASGVLMSLAFMGLDQTTRLPEHPWIQGLLRRCESWHLRRSRPLVLGCVVLVALSLWGASRVEVDTYTLGYLPEHHPVVRDHVALERDWGPYAVVDFIVEPKGERTVNSAEVLAGMGAFVREASALEEVRNGFSLEAFYRRMATVLGASIDDTTPLDRQLVAQLDLLLEMQDYTWDRKDPAYRNNPLAPLMTEEASLGRITLVGSMMSAVALKDLMERVLAIADKHLGEVATVTPAGYPPLYTKIIEYVMQSQIRGFFVAFGLIFALMLVWLRSLRLALISLVPNLLPVGVMMGVMGWLGIHLDVATATVAAIVIGVSIDDTIHFLHAWREAERSGRDWQTCLRHTFGRVGPAAVVTSLLLVTGYPVLMLADVGTVIYFGLLTTIAAVAALFGDLIVLPLVLKLGFRGAAGTVVTAPGHAVAGSDQRPAA